MFVTNWNSTTKIQKISEITNFFRHYFLSRTEVNCYLLSVICYLYSKKNRFWKLSTVTLGDDVIDLSCDILLLYRLHPLSKSSKETFEIVLLIRSFLTRREQPVAPESFK